MRLTFNRAEVVRLMAHAKEAETHAPAYSQTGEIVPSLWLVGDQGVYLMSNGRPGLKEDGGGNVVAYAEQINPDKLEFDVWYPRKRTAFGGDDGVEPITVADIEDCLATYPSLTEPLRISLTPRQMALVGYKRRPSR